MKTNLIITVILSLIIIVGGCGSEPETPSTSPAHTTAAAETAPVSVPQEKTPEIAGTTAEPVSTPTGEDIVEPVSPPAEEEPSPPPETPAEPTVIGPFDPTSSEYILESELCSQDNQIEVYHITYVSDGLKVKGYLAWPKAPGIYPAVIYNRGGNLDFGKLSCTTLSVYAASGFVAIGSQYRGNDGGEGLEEFGGEDINDVMNLIPVLQTLPNVDADKIGMVGYSRGGMMTYLALKEQTLRGLDDIKAACTVGGTADLFMNGENRQDMVTGVFVPLIGGTPEQLPQEFEARSATYWADKINTPLLIQHGEIDWRVSVEESRKLAQELEKYGKVYELIVHPGDDHGLSLHNRGLYEILSWLSEYLDIPVDLRNIARETPLNTVDIAPGEIDNGYFYYETKGYKISAPSPGWSANIPSPPLDVIFSRTTGLGWMGTGAYGGAAYTESFFNDVNDWWVSAMSEKAGWTDVEITDERSLTVAGHSARYVTFEYTSRAMRFLETTYHIWRPVGEYTLYRIRLNCPKDNYNEFRIPFEDFVNSFAFLP